MIRVLRLLWPFTKGRRWAFAGGLAGTLRVTASESARPFPLKFVLDRLPHCRRGVDAGMVAGVALLVVAIATAGAIGTYMAETGMRQAGEHVVHDLP